MIYTYPHNTVVMDCLRQIQDDKLAFFLCVFSLTDEKLRRNIVKVAVKITSRR